MSILSSVRQFTSDVRVVVSIARSLRRLADEAEAVRLQLGFASIKELRELARLAAKEQAEREHRDSLGRPAAEDFEPTETQVALDQLRERLKAGEHVDDTELIAAARAIDQERESEASEY